MEKWAVNNTITKKIDELIPYDSNPRYHSPKQVDQVAKSIEEFGWTMPVLIDENNEIIAGHGRLLAGKKLGLVEVPCIVAKDWSEEKKKAYCIADNKLTENSAWENDFLKLNLEFLKDSGFDLELTGFDKSDLDKLLGDVNFDAGTQDEQSQLDTREPKNVVCPHCGSEFDLNNVEIKA
tara:strand:+ start:1406 stop:1942 length:537 start_codon:yes stop_codon:yes gene_type:complete